MIEDVTDEFTMNKKEASRTKEGAADLQAKGYKIPSHWKNPARERNFIAWDGEGITYDGNVVQSYVLFGCSAGAYVQAPSLSTRQCFDLILQVEQENPDAIHVGFAMQYDFNMMFKDLPDHKLWQIYRSNRVRWNGYRIEYRPGKWLSIGRGKIAARLYDVFGYFQSSFVTACEKFLGKDDPELVPIRAGKASRMAFRYDQLTDIIIPYWRGELRLLVRLMEALRNDLDGAGINVNSWHGPGAVANAVFKQFSIQDHKQDTPPEVSRAAQYAYAGGRFELFRTGHHPATVWEYDINSAYPSVIRSLPSLRKGSWKFARTFQPGSFGVWNIRYDSGGSTSTQLTRPHPLFYRDKRGNVSYPSFVEGWYWTPEAELVPEHVRGGWIFEHDDEESPFRFVEDYYNQRRQWKQDGNSAERALKLALNSLYGKMAQRKGWKEEGDKIPAWHQLEWAGYVTSATRAKLYRAIQLTEPSHIIAIETDAIFTTVPLNLPISNELGEWEASQFDSITYLQNGLYFATQADGTTLEKYRGFDKGSIPYRKVLDHLLYMDGQGSGPPDQTLFGNTTRFIGMGLGLQTSAVWRSWETGKRNIVVGGGGKRGHIKKLCPECKKGLPISSNLHTCVNLTAGGRSYPHHLPWLAGQEPTLRAMDDLAKW